MNDIDKINQITEDISRLTIAITERCIYLYPSSWEDVAKDILYNHNYSQAVDPTLSDLIREMNAAMEAGAEENPYLKLVDENQPDDEHRDLVE